MTKLSPRLQQAALKSSSRRMSLPLMAPLSERTEALREVTVTFASVCSFSVMVESGCVCWATAGTTANSVAPNIYGILFITFDFLLSLKFGQLLRAARCIHLAWASAEWQGVRTSSRFVHKHVFRGECGAMSLQNRGEITNFLPRTSCKKEACGLCSRTRIRQGT